MCASGRAKKNAAMLFLLLLTASCVASDGSQFSQCKAVVWRECVPLTDKPVLLGYTGACVMCEVLSEGVTSGSPFSFVAKAEGVAIRGFPFHVLSAESLTPLDHSRVDTLGLIEAKITDMENNSFVGFTNLEALSLDHNRLAKVKQTWFTGLKQLLMLILSNNCIKQIDPASFSHLTRLTFLDLENNMLQVVDPAWLFGLKGTMIMNLGLNEIKSISPGSFQHLQLTWLDLSGNDLSCLDCVVLREQHVLRMLHISSSMLSSVHDAKPHAMIWSLHRFTSMFRGSTLVVGVPKFLFCVRQTMATPGLSFGWMSASSDRVPGTTGVRDINPGISCGALDRSLSTISIQPPVVVLATNGSVADKVVPNMLEQCRKVHEYDEGIVVDLLRNHVFRLVSMATGNTTFEGVGMSFLQTQDENTHTTTKSGCDKKHTTHANATHDNAKNITCILLTKDEHIVFSAPPVHCQTPTTPTTHLTKTDHSTYLPHYSEHTKRDHTSSEPGDNSTLQVSTTPGSGMTPTTDHVVISVVVSAVVSLVVLSLVMLAWKLRSPKAKAEYEMNSDDAHIWTIPPGVAFPGLLRSASLPAWPNKRTSDDVASCRSLPAVLDSIEPTYGEIPDDIAAAQRPLPGLPHTYWEIPDDAISSVVRSSSLPAVSCTRGGTADDRVSCRSLPAVIQSIEPTYSVIPDNIAAAQRPLPAPPRTAWEISDHGAAAQRPLPESRHTYSEIPDEESGPMPFYADAAELLHHVVRNRRPQRQAFRDVTSASGRHRSGSSVVTYDLAEGTNGRFVVRDRGQQRHAFRDVTSASRGHRSGSSVVTYGLAEGSNIQSNSFYRMSPEVHGLRARRQLRTALVSRPADQGLRTFVNVTDAIVSRGQNVTEAHIAFLALPNTYWPWEISGDGTCITPRRASLPHVTPPNTYWPWEISGEGTRNTPRRTSLPHVTLPNTYWPWEIPSEEGAHDTPRRASLPLVTPPNTYWPWEIPSEEGAHDTPRRASLPLVTPPNTYWPWQIPSEEGAHDTPRRASLPLVTPPNTYWSWEIKVEGTRNTPQRASLPHITPPNTYWPWEITSEGTHDTPHRAPLPLVTLPNKYWPCELPDGALEHCPSSTGTLSQQQLEHCPSSTGTLSQQYWNTVPAALQHCPSSTGTLSQQYWNTVPAALEHCISSTGTLSQQHWNTIPAALEHCPSSTGTLSQQHWNTVAAALEPCHSSTGTLSQQLHKESLR
uniref:LRRCT domain-containing protein n=1 Tax=Branchiostoma floridae TaxID=7739 RepID=C3YQK3_BRAFL|eukprot:XP_002601347.1 hypothetical protein BRAFLDRAFT_82740 [Branchiostoma floridae]